MNMYIIINNIYKYINNVYQFIAFKLQYTVCNYQPGTHTKAQHELLIRKF